MTLVARDEELWAVWAESSGGLRWSAVQGTPVLTAESFRRPTGAPDDDEDFDDDEETDQAPEGEEEDGDEGDNGSGRS